MTADTASASAAPTRLSPWMRYRRQYARLSPPVQMIGLQLWLPLLFVIVFCLCCLCFLSIRKASVPRSTLALPWQNCSPQIDRR